MSHIESEIAFRRNIDLAGEHAFGEGAATLILQQLRDATELIYETSHAGICRAYHRTARLDTAENGVGQMLLRTSRMQKPAIIRHICEQVRSFTNELPGQLADCVLKTNERCDLHVATR